MPGRLLIAEDSRTQREVLVSRLREAGLEVVAAPDGEEALRHVEQGGFDMLISDVVMPGMDGYELCRRVKDHDRRLPVVLLTSMTDPLDVVHGLEAGADNFLRKPYQFAHLLERIEAMLENKKLRDAVASETGLELYFLNQRFMITAERQQILDLLVSTFEDLVRTNEKLRHQEAELAEARDQLRRQLAEAQAQRDRLATVLTSVPQAMVVVDADGIIRGASDALVTLVGARSSADLEGRRTEDVLPLRRHNGEVLRPEQRPITWALRTGVPREMGRAFDLLIEKPDGRRVPVLLRAAPVRAEGRTTGAVGMVHELEAVSLHDPLTRLPGHTEFARHVDEAVARLGATRAGASAVVVVVVLVLDRRSELNDDLGKERKDRLVTALADRLRDALALPAVRQHSSAASAGYLGDAEFTVVLSDLEDEAHGVLAVEALRRHMNGTFRFDDLDVTVTLTAGLTATADPGTHAEELVAGAAAAAHLATRRGGDRIQSSAPGAVERATDRLRREADLRRAIEQGEMRVHYQPIMLLDGGITGVEALVRWDHPDRGMQSPADFIPLAEQSGLVLPLGWEVLRQSCRQVARWRSELPGAGDLTVSVNLSPRQLIHGQLVGQVETALAESGLPPHALTLEVTEADVVPDNQEAASQLRWLRTTGVRVAVDDFGTGYSSLLQLRTLPVDSLKVDRQFVDGLMTDADDAVIVSATIGLAHALRLSVVAEGVETVEQADELHRQGCDFAQGFWWARPLSPADLELWWGSNS